MTGTGVGAIHAGAFAVSDGAATFAGAVLGGAFTNTGYSLSVIGLAPGRYDLVVYMRSTATGSSATRRSCG
jgi:hypothetical protein